MSGAVGMTGVYVLIGVSVFILSVALAVYLTERAAQLKRAARDREEAEQLAREVELARQKAAHADPVDARAARLDELLGTWLLRPTSPEETDARLDELEATLIAARDRK
jgi:flagellar biosynthesis/type III secretory pathway M-ring protein FliF/YscJ